ncbi:MAG TPA: response regulator [Candidatus Paceibacterota bacterium]|nr:response regulator [Candidatus Paceibacterota bacterium]
MKILLVEDEEVLARVLQEKLESENFEVFVARDGAVVLSMTKKIKPDLILLDIMLPKLDGLEVLSALKAEDELKPIPVIMLSNLDEDNKIKRSLEMGAVDYLIKAQHPINEVVEKINDYILKSK